MKNELVFDGWVWKIMYSCKRLKTAKRKSEELGEDYTYTMFENKEKPFAVLQKVRPTKKIEIL